MEPIKGGCLCGAVTFEITARPMHLTYCHCSRCRKASGMSSAVVMVNYEDFRLLSGSAQIRTYQPQAPWKHGRSFCVTCGSSLGELLSEHEVFPVAASALDDDPIVRPILHLNVASKPDWHEIGGDAKQIDGNYGA